MSGPSILLTSSHADLFDEIPFTEALSPLMEITAAIINAGYQGVRVFEFQLINGRFVQALQVQESTPAGKYLSRLERARKQGKALPTIEEALATLARRHTP